MCYKLTNNVQFNLSDFDQYSTLTTGKYYLIFYYEYDEAAPNDKGVFDLISQSDYITNNYEENSKYVKLTILDIVVT